MEKYLLCCDWGTSSFRLRLINLSDNRMVGEVLSSEGIAATYNGWKLIRKNNLIARAPFFQNYLKEQIDILATRLSFNLDKVTVIISGMASSSIGMEEIPYTHLPYIVDGSQSGIRFFDMSEAFPHEIMLISGVKSDSDVMRGEETQLVGLLNLRELSSFQTREAIFIFPGTHSKHMYVQGNELIGFQTFMTGEIFKIMSLYSILKDSVETGNQADLTDEEISAFRLGIRESECANILNSLFKVRTNQLFDKMNQTENALYMSGLLIGSELKDLKEKENWNLILCSGNNLYELYRLGIEELGLTQRTTTVSAAVIDKATVAGQIKIFQNQKIKLNNSNS